MLKSETDNDVVVIELGAVTEVTRGIPPYQVSETQGMMPLTGGLGDD